jgi:Ca2+-binding EF-hand superfamily protein
LFGGNPLDADRDRDNRVTHDEVWVWTREQFGVIDRDRSGTISANEIGRDARSQAAFRAADVNRDGFVTMDELRSHSQTVFQVRDSNGDGALTRDEVPPRSTKAARKPPRN